MMSCGSASVGSSPAATLLLGTSASTQEHVLSVTGRVGSLASSASTTSTNSSGRGSSIANIAVVGTSALLLAASPRNGRRKQHHRSEDEATTVYDDEEDSGCVMDEYAWVPCGGGAQPDAIHNYFAALPDHKVPYVNSAGEQWRARQLKRQLPPQDSDARFCRAGLSVAEAQELRAFDATRRQQCAGRAEITRLTRCIEGGAENMSVGGGGKQYCHQCKGSLNTNELVVHAPQRFTGSPPAVWHPQCFVCVECRELLVDLVYFKHQENVFCGRHHAEQLKPRCTACDELIFSEECTEAEGAVWHLRHFACTACRRPLGGQRYVMMPRNNDNDSNDDGNNNNNDDGDNDGDVGQMMPGTSSNDVSAEECQPQGRRQMVPFCVYCYARSGGDSRLTQDGSETNSISKNNNNNNKQQTCCHCRSNGGDDDRKAVLQLPPPPAHPPPPPGDRDIPILCQATTRGSTVSTENVYETVISCRASTASPSAATVPSCSALSSPSGHQKASSPCHQYHGAVEKKNRCRSCCNCSCRCRLDSSKGHRLSAYSLNSTSDESDTEEDDDYWLQYITGRLADVELRTAHMGAVRTKARSRSADGRRSGRGKRSRKQVNARCHPRRDERPTVPPSVVVSKTVAAKPFNGKAPPPPPRQNVYSAMPPEDIDAVVPWWSRRRCRFPQPAVAQQATFPPPLSDERHGGEPHRRYRSERQPEVHQLNATVCPCDGTDGTSGTSTSETTTDSEGEHQFMSLSARRWSRFQRSGTTASHALSQLLISPPLNRRHDHNHKRRRHDHRERNDQRRKAASAISAPSSGRMLIPASFSFSSQKELMAAAVATASASTKKPRKQRGVAEAATIGYCNEAGVLSPTGNHNKCNMLSNNNFLLQQQQKQQMLAQQQRQQIAVDLQKQQFIGQQQMVWQQQQQQFLKQQQRHQQPVAMGRKSASGVRFAKTTKNTNSSSNCIVS